MKPLSLEGAPNNQEVQGVLKAALSSMEENFVALVDKEVSLSAESTGLMSREELIDQMGSKRCPSMSGVVGKGYAGNIIILVNLADSITFSCYLRMIADEAVKERRGKGTYDEEDKESFGEVGNILFSAVDEVFRNKLPKAVSFRLETATVLEPGTNDGEIIPDEPLYVVALSMKIGDFPEGPCVLVMPKSLAEDMNGGPFATAEAVEGEEESEEPLPTELEGTVALFGLSDSTTRLVREATKKVGLELEVHSPGEVPNPATLKEKIVLLEVPEDGEKHFQWCGRLKKSNVASPIVAALGWPSKRNVLMAYKTGVDQILGLPCQPNDLIRRFGRIIKAQAESAEAVEAE